MMPVSTSPVPAVASALVPVALRCMRRAVVDERVAPFKQRRDAGAVDELAQARYAFAVAIVPFPESRANSPACGVTTTVLPRNKSRCFAR